MVLIILSLAVLVNSLANIPYTLIQAFADRISPRNSTWPVDSHILLLWLLSFPNLGLPVAVAWLARVSADALLLFWYADRLLTLKAAGQRSMVLFVIMSVVPVAIYLLIMALNLAVPGLISRCVLTLITLILLALGVWQYLLDDGEKSVLKRLKNFRSQDTQSLN